MEMTLEQIAAATSGTVRGGNPTVAGVSTDSRTVKAGNLFVALDGENFDGHQFVAQALSGGAVAVMVNAAKAVIHVEKADMDAVMAWKNGFFAFSDTPVKEVMQSFARWYDLTVVYEGKIPEQRFGGKIYRETPLSGVMKILGETGIAYEIKNGKVIIKSK